MRLRALAFLVALLPCAVTAAPSDDLKSLIDQGKAVDAYALGKQTAREPSDELFDYYLGLAAVDSGRTAEGVGIRKRYVDGHPNDHRARLELGRGYFLLDDNRRAREEFEAVKKSNPPPEVVANIDLFLVAIRQRETQRVLRSAWVELSALIMQTTSAILDRSDESVSILMLRRS